MQRVNSIVQLQSRDLGEELFQALLELAPMSTVFEDEQYDIRQLQVVVPVGDPILEAIVELLTKSGWTRGERRTRSARKEFFVGEETLLDDSDWAAAEFVVIAGGSFGGKPPRFDPPGEVLHEINGGEVVMPSTVFRADEEFVFSLPNEFDRVILVPDRVRTLIETEFPEARFFEVRAAKPGSLDEDEPIILDWNPEHERWWQLYSSVTMPWPGPGCRLRPYNRTDPSPPPPGSEFPTVFAPDDDGLEIPHYRRSDIEAMGPFDLAIAAEKFNHYDRARSLIASRRFWQWSLDRGIDFHKKLVRIDDE